MNEVRFGVVGCGAIHSTHCTALGKIANAKLAGVYDIVPERTTAAAEKFDVPGFGSLDELCENVDAVTVCVPSGLHAETGIHAARAGKHVLCEKPIDVSADKAANLIKACLENGVALGVISQHRFAPEVRKVKEIVQKGDLGQVLHCDVYNKWLRTQAYYDSGDWRGTKALDGGCMMNQGIHYIDLAQWLMGGAESVQCNASTVSHDMEAEDNAVAFVKYKNGATGLLQVATTCYPGFAERIEIHGTVGSVILEADHIKYLEIDPEAAQAGFYGKGVVAHPVPPAQPGASSDPLSLWDVLHLEQITDFVDSVLNGRTPEVTGEEGIKPVKEILACYESAAQDGKRVCIS